MLPTGYQLPNETFPDPATATGAESHVSIDDQASTITPDTERISLSQDHAESLASEAKEGDLVEAIRQARKQDELITNKMTEIAQDQLRRAMDNQAERIELLEQSRKTFEDHNGKTKQRIGELQQNLQAVKQSSSSPEREKQAIELEAAIRSLEVDLKNLSSLRQKREELLRASLNNDRADRAA